MTRLLRFDQFMEHALYDPDTGFFGSTVGADGQAGGAHGDFITSPETGPLFGLLVARFLHCRWERVGCPTHFDVVEYGAGRGALAIAIRVALDDVADWGPFAAALRYHMVERSEPLRVAQAEHLTITPLVGTTGPGSGSGSGGQAAVATAVAVHQTVPVAAADTATFYSHRDESTLPNEVDVIFANELLDNVPLSVFERVGIDDPDDPDWVQVMVAPPEPPSTTWVEHLQPGEPDDAVLVRRLTPDAPVGARAPLQTRAGEWLTDALERVGPTGTVVVIDYCRSTADMAVIDQSEWLRTYRGHQRCGSPLEDPGSRDITCDVAIDQLGLVRRPSENHSQADWLRDLGIDELVDEGRRIWTEKAASPDLAAMRARSRISEAEALCDPDGLGAFRVLIWQG